MQPYYEHAEITLYHGNCLDILPTLDPCDLVLTDPPYEAEAHINQRRVTRAGGILKLEPLAFPPITAEQRSAFSVQAARLAKRWALVFCQIEGAPLWREQMEDSGMVYRRTCIWVKPDGQPQYTGDRPGMGYEALLAMHAPGRSEWNGGGRHGVFVFNKSCGPGRNEHPTEKPLPLIKELINLFSNPGDTILDPFMGSGTTLRAAEDLGRKAIGIEVNEEYCEIAVRRLSQEVLNLEAA